MDTSNTLLDDAPHGAYPVLTDISPQLVEEHDADNRLVGRSWLREGVLHGMMERFWSNGVQQLCANYDNGLLDGLLLQFDEDGSPAQLAAYVQGRQHGLMRVFTKGRCLSEQNFENGQAHGPAVMFNEAGHATARLRYQHGQLDGPATFLHENKVVRRATYQADMLEGEVSDFDRDGGLIQVATYCVNVLHGPLRRYWPDGALMEEITYRQGVPAGPPMRFDAKGRQLDNDEATPGLLARLEKLVKG